MKTAVQQMMLGSICTSEEKTLEVLGQIRKAGYEGIEIDQYMVHPTSLFVRGLTKAAGMPSGNAGKYDWPKLLKETDLKAVSLHTDLDTLENKYDYVLEDVRRFEVDTVVITGMYNYPYHREEKAKELSERLNRCGSCLKENGIRLLYHNHNVEFSRVNETETAYDVLIRECDPDLVNFELDAYWCADAGKDPLQVMKVLKDRLVLWHITDRGIRIKRTPITPIVKYDSVELGQGNLDLKSLFEYTKQKGLSWCILESHKNWINGSPMESILLSGKYLKENI